MRPYNLIILAAIFTFSHVALAQPKTEPGKGAAPQYRTMRYTPRPANDARNWQRDVRAKLFGILKIEDLLAKRDGFAFDAKEISFADSGTHLVKELQIRSTPGRSIRIIVTVPSSSKGPVPAVVCIGGHGSNQYSPYNEQTVAKDSSRVKADRIYKGFGTILAKKGYVTISTTVSQHTVYEDGRLLMAERLWDLIRCVDYLQSMPEVDGSRIGCAGLSLGGEMTMWLGAMDERIAATVSSGFLTTMDNMEQNHCMCWKFEGLREVVDYADIYSLIAPRSLQCQNGLLEPPSQFYVPLARQAMEEIRTIYRDLDRPENVVLDVHEEGHVIDLPALLYFFEKHLYHNRWTEPTDARP